MKRTLGTLAGLLFLTTLNAQPSTADYILLASSAAFVNVAFELLKESINTKIEQPTPSHQKISTGGFSIPATKIAEKLPAIQTGKDVWIVTSTAFATERTAGLLTAVPLMVCRHYKADAQGKRLLQRIMLKHPQSAPYADRAPIIYAALEGALVGALSVFAAGHLTQSNNSTKPQS